MKLDPIGQLFAGAWKRFRERFAVAVGIYLLPLVVVGIGELLVHEQERPAAVLLGALILLIGIVSSLFAAIGLISTFGKGTNFGESYAAGAKFFWAFLWITILTSFVTWGGFIMLIIPGIMLSVQLMFASYVLIIEDRHGMAALTQSREYVKGYWWAIVGRSFLLGFCLLAAILVIFLPATLLFGPIVGGIFYGAILLLFTPFSVAYLTEIFENLRRLKPDAAAGAAKQDRAFLKVSMVIGIIAIPAVIVSIILVAIFAPARMGTGQGPYGGGYVNENGSYPSDSNEQAMIDPQSGPVGTMVTISGLDPEELGATETVLMDDMVAARNVTVADDGTLSFTVPANLAPDCDPTQACPQFLMLTSPKEYTISLEEYANNPDAVEVGDFTVTGSLQ